MLYTQVEKCIEQDERCINMHILVPATTRESFKKSRNRVHVREKVANKQLFS